MNNFYSNGKLLISGEYLILEGALALAVPVKYGQSLKVEESSSAKIVWQTNVNGELWFNTEFDNHFNIIKTSNNDLAIYLSNLLKAARRLNANFVVDFGYDVLSEINFDINWGLGSSSSLISNIAWWANVDPFQLFMLVANGSGYDIACARSEKAVHYHLNDGEADYEQVGFFPDFCEHIYFAYLGTKQNSEKSVLKFKQKANFSENDILSVSNISEAFIKAKGIEEYSSLMVEHERIIGHVLAEIPVKDAFFSDFEGEIKSLGAWGGDFILATGNENTPDYFKNKGFQTVIRYQEMIL